MVGRLGLIPTVLVCFAASLLAIKLANTNERVSFWVSGTVGQANGPGNPGTGNA
jgi:hypothetical protein